MDTVTEGLVLVDAKRSIRLINAAAATYLPQLTTARLGQTLTHLGSRSLHSFFVPPSTGLRYHEVTTEPPMQQIFEVTATPMKPDDDLEAWVLVLRDVTEERSLQRYALQQDRLAAIGELAAGIAHDFNNILTPILLYTDMTMNQLVPDSLLRSNLQQVLRATHRAKNLVSQILTFSRETTQQRRPIEVRLVIEEVLKLMRAVLPATIEIRENLDGQMRTVLADSTQIHQVLMNLCTNAYHAMRSLPGVLTVTLDTLTVDTTVAAQHVNSEPGEYVRVTVSDTGQGMDQATMGYIFDPFFTTKAVGEGTGMGLAVVYGIITDYKGFITVESQVGHGTTFQIYLPQLNSNYTTMYSPATQERVAVEAGVVIEDRARLLEFQIGT